MYIIQMNAVCTCLYNYNYMCQYIYIYIYYNYIMQYTSNLCNFSPVVRSFYSQVKFESPAPKIISFCGYPETLLGNGTGNQWMNSVTEAANYMSKSPDADWILQAVFLKAFLAGHKQTCIPWPGTRDFEHSDVRLANVRIVTNRSK